MDVRVRFAPSPTGFLHFGGVRTALFNWLFARHEKGRFLLRIEDTDKERSEKRFEEDILKGLEWLGISPDEPPVRQSDRLDLYERHLEALFRDRRAYYCFCSAEELEAESQAQLAAGIIPKYSGKCRSLPSEEAAARAKKEPAVIRFRMPEKEITFTDLIRGKVSFHTKFFGDIIIAKGLREPLYNFAVVVDDAEMRISHVFRGEEHLSNTPKQIALAEALGLSVPVFGHLPLILGPDKKKLSKRVLTTSLDEYEKKGYLPGAILNFLAFLGWHPSDDREVLTVGDLVNEFTIKRVQKAGAIYNPEKLEWLNSMHIRALAPETLKTHLMPFMPASWRDDSRLPKAILLVKDRLKNLAEFQSAARFLFELPAYPASLLTWKNSTPEKARAHLSAVRTIIEQSGEKECEDGTLGKAVMAYAEKEGRGEVLWPVRVALSGSEASPGPVELLQALGAKESLSRIDYALNH